MVHRRVRKPAPSRRRLRREGILFSVMAIVLLAVVVAVLLAAMFFAMRIYPTLDLEFEVIGIKFKLSGRR